MEGKEPKRGIEIEEMQKENVSERVEEWLKKIVERKKQGEERISELG